MKLTIDNSSTIKSIDLPPKIILALADTWNEQLRIIDESLIPVKEDMGLEALHNLRVALRKTRTLLKIFGSHLPSVKKLEEEFRWFSGLTNPIRDADILLNDAHELVVDVELKGLIDDVKKQRLSAHSQLKRAIDSPRLSALLTQFRTYVTALPSEKTSDEAKFKSETLFLHALVLRHTYELLKKSLRIKRGASSKKLHKLRIRGKRLRYLMESFSDLMGNEGTRTLHKKIKKLQLVLGEHHDNVMMIAALRSMELKSHQRLKPKDEKALSRWLHLTKQRQRNARIDYQRAIIKVATASKHLPI